MLTGQHTGTGGFWGRGSGATCRLAKLAVGYTKPLAPEHPPVPVCINYRAWHAGEKKRQRLYRFNILLQNQATFKHLQ